MASNLLILPRPSSSPFALSTTLSHHSSFPRRLPMHQSLAVLKVVSCFFRPKDPGFPQPLGQVIT